jgi:lipopolysaccharide transport system ATP-binding protein
MSDVVIQVHDLWKKYRLGVLGTGTLRHDFNRWWHRVRGKPDPYTKVGQGQMSPDVSQKSEPTSGLTSDLRPPTSGLSDDEVWALQGVSFEVKQGEILGIIGKNGAGKSTLLKILSRVTAPTSGEVRVKGRIASLLEVGTGFHPELTGRENIFLNGAILGMTKAEIKKKFDEIVDFSGVEQFIDTPVKRYSSGMYVRLAFAVAAHLEPEILVVDEVLAVGDAEFQTKCLGKMREVSTNDGRTVLFVSHNMQAVSVLCNRGLFLSGGSVAVAGEIKKAMDCYMSSILESKTNETFPGLRSGSGEYRFSSVCPVRDFFLSAETKTIQFKAHRIKQNNETMWLSAHVVNSLGNVLVQCDSRLVGLWFEDCENFNGLFRFNTPWLKPGKYRIDLFICTKKGVIDSWEDACLLTIAPTLPYSQIISEDGISDGLIFADFSWEAKPHERATAITNLTIR